MSGSGRLALLGVAALVSALAAAIVAPADSRVPTALALLGLVVLATAAGLARGRLRQALTGRRVRHGAMAVAYTAAVFVVLAAAALLASRHAVRWDLTQERLHTLSARSQNIVASIPASGLPVELVGIDSTGHGGQRLRQLVELFDAASPRLTGRVVVAEQEPGLVRELGVTRFPSVVVRHRVAGEEAPRQRITDVVDEVHVARALEAALLGELPTAYVLAGHGERGTDDAGPQGFLVAATELRGDNHAIATLGLAHAGVPDDAALLVIPGPETDLLEGEVEALREHAAGGGRILLLLGPVRRAGAQPRLIGWLHDEWGIDAREDLVADLDGPVRRGGDLLTLVVTPPAGAVHPVVRGLRKQVVLPLCRTVRPRELLPVGVTVTTLLSSGPQSWAETDLSSGRPDFEAAVDESGPLPVAVAAVRRPHGQPTEARLVVVGSTSFAANHAFFQQGNPDFLLDAVAWLTERTEVIEARRRAGRDGTVVVAAPQFRVMSLVAVAMPVVVLLGGAAQWWQRRRA